MPYLTKLFTRGLKHADMFDVEISLPSKKRSTGPYSQNNHAHGHAQQIASETGHEIYEIETIVKNKAIKRGYPYKIVMGEIVPYSQKYINTIECGYLIDEYHQLAAELGIELMEG